MYNKKKRNQGSIPPPPEDGSILEHFHLSDWEDSVDFEMGIKDFSAGGILDILTELENIEQFLEDYNETIVTEYNPDYEPKDQTL